jgi:signal transduction histidine kinase
MKRNFNLQELLGGRNSFNLGPYIFFSPLMILVNPIIQTNLSDRRNFVLWLLVSFVSFSGQILIIALFQLILTRKVDFKLLPIWTLFVVGLIAGTFRSFVNAELAHYLGLLSRIGELGPSSNLRALLAGFLLVPIFGVLSNYISLIRSKRSILMEKLLVLKSINFESQAGLLLVRQKARESIEEEYSLLITETKRQILNTEGQSLADQYEHIARTLTESAEDLIRPLSHRLMEEEVEDFPFPKLPTIFFLALSKPILPLLPIQILTLISTVASVSTEVTSVFKIFFLCLIQISLVSMQILGIRIFLRKRKIQRKFNLIPFVIAFSTVVTVWANKFLIEFFYQEQYRFLQLNSLIYGFLWWLTILLIVSFLANLMQSEVKSEDFISSLINSKSLDLLLLQKETLDVRQEIARYLHGNLQSRLMALGLSLQIKEVKDQSGIDSAITIAQSLLDSPFAELIATEQRSLSDEVTNNTSRWDGLLKVDSHLEIPDSRLSPIQVRAIGKAIEEALANSLRHGLAKEIEIRIYEDEFGVVLSVQDDGIGPRNTPHGLGSRLFDMIATRGWSLNYRPDDLGSILELKF